MDILALAADYAPEALTIVLVFSALIFVHEWGHYAAARACGVRVEEFSIGFGPEVAGFDDSRGTRWKVCAVPLGGYVKMFGDEGPTGAGKDAAIPAELESEAFYNKPVWRRAVVVAAGPLVNYAFALVLLFGLYATVGKHSAPPVAAAVGVGSVAQEIGIAPGDVVVSIDGAPMESFQDVRRTMVLSRGEEKVIVLRRGGEEITLTAAPQVEQHTDRLGFKSSQAALGISSPAAMLEIGSIQSVNGAEFKLESQARAALCAGLGTRMEIALRGEEGAVIAAPRAADNPDCLEVEALALGSAQELASVRMPVGTALAEAGAEVWEANASILRSFGQILTGTRSAMEMGGLPRIALVISDASNSGIAAVIVIAAFLSITLGLINLFPIPVLDGGHLLFYAIEAIRGGRPVPEKVQELAFQAGFVFIIGVMLFTNGNDIVQLMW